MSGSADLAFMDAYLILAARLDHIDSAVFDAEPVDMTGFSDRYLFVLREFVSAVRFAVHSDFDSIAPGRNEKSGERKCSP